MAWKEACEAMVKRLDGLYKDYDAPKTRSPGGYVSIILQGDVNSFTPSLLRVLQNSKGGFCPGCGRDLQGRASL
jgi:hypothetical protein